MVKTLSKLGIEGDFLNLIKNVYRKPTVNIILNGEKPEFFYKDQRQGKDVSIIAFQYHTGISC